MFVVNDDLSIYVTRGDMVFFPVKAKNELTGDYYEFQTGDVVQFKICAKKNAGDVVLEKLFHVGLNTDAVGIVLYGDETTIGDVISKPTDYWYSVTLNPDTNPQTIIGYDEDGAKLFRLFPN